SKCLRQRRRDFERAESTVKLKLRIDFDALRFSFQVEVKVNACSVGRHPNRAGLDALVGLDNDRHLQCEKFYTLRLSHGEVQAVAMACRGVKLQFGNSNIVDPLIKERPQIKTCDRLETLSDIVK